MNFIYGTYLAREQDWLINTFKDNRISGQTRLAIIDSLKGNLWVKSAAILAPSNLVVRQWCLIDLFQNSPRHAQKLINILNRVGPVNTLKGGNNVRLWLEGYSYWAYTLNVLQIWMDRFVISSNYKSLIIKSIVREIDNGFIESSYMKDGKMMPVPFGDLREGPLSVDLQCGRDNKSFNYKSKCGFSINKGTNAYVVLSGGFSGSGITPGETYLIKPVPIGLNLHVPNKPSIVNINNGMVLGFRFYEGYNSKYPTLTDELKDMFKWSRISHVIN